MLAEASGGRHRDGGLRRLPSRDCGARGRVGDREAGRYRLDCYGDCSRGRTREIRVAAIDGGDGIGSDGQAVAAIGGCAAGARSRAEGGCAIHERDRSGRRTAAGSRLHSCVKTDAHAGVCRHRALIASKIGEGERPIEASCREIGIAVQPVADARADEVLTVLVYSVFLELAVVLVIVIRL